MNKLIFLILLIIVNLNAKATSSNKASPKNPFETSSQRIEKQVDNAYTILENNSFEKAISMIGNPELIYGKEAVFILDFEGNIIQQYINPQNIWSNIFNAQDKFGKKYIEAILNQASQDSGWVSYAWQGTTKFTFVKKIEKENTPYVIGSGFYPYTKWSAAVNMVDNAVNYFYKNTTEESFAAFSYPVGEFISGDLYVFAFDLEGNCLAHGNDPGLIGQNLYDLQDPDGKYFIRDFIEKVKLVDYAWSDYIWYGAPKKSYITKVTDQISNKKYILGVGYYPNTNREKVEEYVKRGFSFLKFNGVSHAVKEFQNRLGNYVYGDIFLFVYDLKGNCLANGEKPSWIGQNVLSIENQDGVKPIELLIDKAQRGGGWIDYQWNNGNTSAYIEPINIGPEKALIGSSFYPISQYEFAILTANSIYDEIEQEGEEKVFNKLVSGNSKFLRGDLDTRIYDINGNCLASNNYQHIWKKYFDAVDQTGKPYFIKMAKSAEQGLGWIETKQRNATKKTFTLRAGNRQFMGLPYFITTSFFE
ncbi:MAG: hypothetical protein UR26_C0001G0025 [candidate division TM6 bacterium GW2011_GWF2_32_72]|nr:MAG: hypothetical protein UR26_C0001G0025 [candidate division TM6 bacterium GW2011_GWF2_32_72]